MRTDISDAVLPNRRQFLGGAAAAGLTLAAGRSSATGTSASARRPNVIFILADDLGWGDAGCYGSPIAKTPQIDRLAREGMRFTNFYVSAPVCSPTRVGFITGRFPSALRIHSYFEDPEKNELLGMPNALDPDVPTVADHFKRAGYVTGHFGKWHMGDLEPKEYGFDEYRVIAGGGPYGWPNERHFPQRSSDLIVSAALDFIQTNVNRPFYLQTWLRHPHVPLDPSEEQMAAYPESKDNQVSGTFTDPFRVYYATVTEMDRNIGRLLAKLDELTLTQDTIVVFSSDNGPECIYAVDAAYSGVGSAGPFRGRKRSLYEGGIRTPLIARWPGKIPDGRIDDTTILTGIDFPLTICRLAGVAVPEADQLDGEDMSRALLGEPQDRLRPLFWETRYKDIGDPINNSPMMAIRQGPWKLLMNPDRSRIELHNIPNDPMEVDNLADQHADLVKTLSATLLQWHRSLPKSPIPQRAGALVFPWPK